MKRGIIIETNRDYHGDKTALSKSRLMNMAKSPAFFKWSEDNPEERSEDLVIGSAFHKLLLEKDGFADEFAVLPMNIDRRTKAGKEMYSQFIDKNQGKDIISQADFEMIWDMCESVVSNKYSAKLLKGYHEQSMYFVDELTNVQCKVRPDCYKIVGDRVIITDFKSCKSAIAEDFMRDIVKYGYDLQAYMYRFGVSKTLNIPIENVSFVFVPVEKKAPYLNAIYEATQDIFDRGEMLFRKYIGMYKECKDTNNWYGYNGFTNEPMTIGLPDWITKNNKQGE